MLRKTTSFVLVLISSIFILLAACNSNEMNSTATAQIRTGPTEAPVQAVTASPTNTPAPTGTASITPTPTPSETPTSTPTLTPTPTSTSTPTPRLFTEEELTAALLTAEDMPDGWALVALDEEGITLEFSVQGPPQGSLFTIERQFRKEGRGGFFTHGITAFSPGGEDATDALADVVSDIEAKTPYTSTQIDGSTMIVEVSFLPFPALGDETVAVRYSTEQFPLVGLVEIYGVLIRQGDIITTLASISFGTPQIDTEQLGTLAQRALEKQDVVLENRE